jgi:peptide/nickel transport system permease protein
MLRAFFRAPGGVVSILALLFIAVIAIIGPPIWGHEADVLHVVNANKGPSAQHLLGTDPLGRDLLLRVVVSTRISLLIALAAAGLGALIGIPLGAGAAVLPLRLRSIALRAIDALIVFPGILIAIIVGVIVGKGAAGAALGVGIGASFAFARVASTLTMSVSSRDYVAAARVVGIRGPRLLFRYVIPNIADTLAIATTVVISSSIVQISALSFLGLGVQAPSYDWGDLLTQGVQNLYTNPAAALGPVAAIAISALTFGFAGEGLARMFNPLLWARVHGKPPVAKKSIPTHVSDRDTSSMQSQNGDLALEISDLVVQFPGSAGPVRIVDGVSFRLPKGQTLGIVGESGSGKTMTAMAIAKLVSYPGTVDGTVKLQGEDLKEIPLAEFDRRLGTSLAVVFQDPLLSLNPALKIGQQLTEGVRYHRKLSHSAAVELATSRLREVAIPTPGRQLRRYPHELSGGMQQRAMIAMGLMNSPALLIADEPTTALDVTTQAQIMDLLSGINTEHGTALILISHNLVLVSQVCDRVIVMYAGRIVEELSADELVSSPLHPYTAGLIAAIPDMTRSPETELASIPGQVPDYASLPTGCSYHPRCPFAVEKCAKETPPLVARADGRRVACWVANGDSA